VSTAKGLAYALNIPLISVSTLQIMAESAYSVQKEEAFYCPMIDARRMRFIQPLRQNVKSKNRDRGPYSR